MERLFQWLDSFRSANLVRAAFGEPRTVDGRTLIPVASVVYGFGGRMSGRVTSLAMARGPEPEPGDKLPRETPSGGMRSSPVAVISISSEGVQVHEIVNRTPVLLAILALLGLAGIMVLRFLACRRACRPAGSTG